MHSGLLRPFLGVVEKRNITVASEALNISQPALTRSIRQLEKTIGVPLFERLPTGMVLTKPGEVFARHTIGVCSCTDDELAAFSEDRQFALPPIRVSS